MPKLRPGEHNTTVALCDEDRERIDSQIHGTDSRAQWLRTAAEMRLELEAAAEAAGMADELGDDWWRDWLYDAAREKAHEQWAREASGGATDEREREQEAD